MTREEITKEAQEQVNYCTPIHPEDFIQGYIAGAEPREKRITELKTQQLAKAKEIIKELARVEYADFTNGDYSNELSKVLEQAEQFLKEIEK